MKKTLTSLIVTCCVSACVAQTTFSKFYSYLNGADGSNNALIHDGSIYFPFQSYINSNYHPLTLAKVNINTGDTLWTVLHNDPNSYIINYSTLSVSSDAMVSCCYYVNTSSINYYYYLYKTDTNGNEIFFNIINPDTNYYIEGFTTIETMDNGFLITGQKYDKAFTDGNIYIIKTDSNGNYLWDKEYNYPNWDAGWASIELPDHGFFIIGQTRSLGAGQRDWLLIRTDSLGNENWHKTFGYPEIDTPINISKTKDGNYLIAGQMEFNNFSKAAIYKIDTSGCVKWFKYYAIKEQTEFWKATELIDGSIIAAGLAEDTSDYIGKGLLMKVDTAGNELWHRIFPVGNNHAWFRNVYPTADGGFIMPGSAVDGPSGNQDAWLVKVDSLGCDSNGCALYTALPPATTYHLHNSELQAYPNPCGNFFTL